jgi:hypothetical protein
VSPFLTRSADAAGDFLERKSPRLLREYVMHLNDWLRIIRNTFPRRSVEAREMQKKARTILINFLILIMIIAVGTFALQYVEVLVEHLPLRRDIIALLMGSLILALCLPSVFLIWRSLRSIINDATVHALGHTRTWRGERVQVVLRQSITIILAIFIFLWMIPLITQFVFIGSSALAIPAIILAFALYLVIRSIRGVNRQLERTFFRVFLGEQQDSSPVEDSLPASRPSLIGRLIHSLKCLVARLSSLLLSSHEEAGKADKERKNNDHSEPEG